ncbi:3'-5' exonuclease [Prosthecobacter vanneervenii]|uniref:DNA 3'-5' helicase n=1 Tax=Prosthecobacter vanneervenii TaxID=48466 RepID=A0A7W8DLR8_9BACT|nr:3'-5' exonuclease [Prosthecobacter vanneervenii]MBB5034116.1 mRNA-degrading endonuclease RelE of RelBE toxin-antitoxin system [Prosthecobacter vanneervenii]
MRAIKVASSKYHPGEEDTLLKSTGTEFRIADTFTDSLARLTGDEQKAVKTTAFDLQINPANPGMSFHKLDKARDKNFWSVRVNRDIRLIVHKSDANLLLCYVDHHDKAYDWAERRKLETHPKTGAAQLVEIRETVHEIFVPTYVQQELPEPKPRKRQLFAQCSDDELLSYGVPSEWLADVRQADEDTLLLLSDRLPTEAAEALLELATGGKPRIPQTAPVTANPFEHPDAQRRFRVMSNVEELERALEFPWDKWSVFLHPDQRHSVERNYSGPARVSGSAGTGKTIVAVHRAVFLARNNPNARVLLTTFSHILANSLRSKLRRLISNEPRLAERLEVHSIEAIGSRLYKAHFGTANIASRSDILKIIAEASKAVAGHKFSSQFLLSEWEQIVDAWQLNTWESYRDVVRLGRKTRLPEAQRALLWQIFENVRSQLAARKLVTVSEMFTKLAAAIHKDKNPPFDFAVVDEAQDIGIAHLRFLAAIGAKRPDALFFAGDLGQRIFQQPFSWLALGVDIRGRSRNLRINYRTSHQIRTQADRLLGPEISDVDGNKEQRDETVSVFNGPPPDIRILKTEEEEIVAVADWLTARKDEGIAPHEFGIFVRSEAQLERAREAVQKAGIPFKTLDEQVETTSGFASICTMHLAKGLEFRAVAVMACDDEVLPLQERIESISDDADLEEVYNTERHLLYVACTRARDQLLITGISPASEFIEDLRT